MPEAGLWETAFLWRDAVLAVAIGGALLAYLGFYVVLTRNAFVSAAVSQLAGLGFVISLWLHAHPDDSSVNVVIGIAIGVAAALLLAIPKTQRLPPDAVLAMIVVGASALTLIAGRYLALDYRHVQAALFGDVVAASPHELAKLSLLVVIVAALHVQFRQRFLLLIFDPDAARAAGMAVHAWGLLLAITIGVTIAITTRTFGALTAFAFSVAPAAAALLVARSFRAAVWLAIAVASVAAVGGYFASYATDLPAGPTIVVAMLAALSAGAFVNHLRRRSHH